MIILDPSTSLSDPDVEVVNRIAAVPTILDVVCRITGMGFAAVARVTEGRWIACGVRDGIGFGLQPGGELKIETTICNEVRQCRQPIVIDNVSKDETYRNHPTPAMYGFQSYISVPIILADGSFFGTLCAIDPEARSFDKAAIASSFTLFAELIGFHLDAHTKLAKSEMALSREREMSDLREQFIAVLGHDLRNPLASVAAGTRLLLKFPDRAAQLAPQIEQSISRIAGLIDDVLDFARGRLGGGVPIALDETGNIEPTLVQVIQELQSAHPDRQIETEFALQQPVVCDRARIAQLLSNLLANALTHGAPAKPVIVGASALGRTFELWVANQGPPISAAAIDRLFQPFFRGAIRHSQEGLGLGLFIASEVAKAHGGHLRVSSTQAETRFTFQMPCGA